MPLRNKQNYREILDALPIAVYTTDADGRITFYNKAAALLWGREPALEQEQWCGSYRLYTADGTPLALENCPMGIALRENRPVRDVKAIGERPDGSRFTFIPYPTPIKDETGNLIGGINMLVEQHDPLAAAASDLTRQIQTLSLLHELSAFLADCIDTDESLAKILETLTELHGARFGLIMLYDSTKNVLYEVASRGFEEDNAFTVTPGSSAGGSGTCFWSKTRVIIEDTEVDLRFENHREAARKTGVRAVHSTPVLMRDGSIAGTISVYLDIPRQPDRREMQAADMCARYIAQVLRSSQLKQE